MSEVQGALPKHIAIIMDGNGRWARKRLQPRFMGHRAGVKAVENIVRACIENKVEVLSLFAFSSENWKRPEKEVSLLMELFALALNKQVKRLHENNIRIKVIGDLSRFSPSIQQKVADAHTLTANNTRLTVVVAANYGGRWDITQATKKIATEVSAGLLAAEDVNEQTINERLSLAGLPDPDLFIRTGGEQRVSNFLLWQLAYTEFYFTETLWPDFDAVILNTAIASFSGRERRFGRTSEQLTETPNA